jgi:tetratricopeptide (TPR) repeat protein
VKSVGTSAAFPGSVSRGLVHLRSPFQKLLFLSIVAVPVAVFVFQTARIAIAETWGDSLAPSTLLRAISLDPQNAKLHYLVAMVFLFSPEANDRAKSVGELRTAVGLHPRSATYWSGLGKSCYVAGDQLCAREAFARAAILAPSKPQYAWDVAMNRVIAGESSEALTYCRRFLQLQPDKTQDVFQLLQSRFQDPDLIWSGLLAPSRSPSLKLAYLNFLAANGNFDAAGRHWAELVTANQPIPLTGVKPYLESLLTAGHYQAAVDLWHYLARTGALGNAAAPDPNNLVFNGGFEQEPLNAGFDWRYQPQAFLDLDFSDPSARSGRRALRLEFVLPKNLEYEAASELVPVSPGQSYALTAYLRSENITSTSGPCLRVSDPKCPACLNVATANVTGTKPWHEAKVEFTAGMDTEVVRISIWRPRSRIFPMDISGRAWVDDVSLRAIPELTKTQAN